MTDEQRAGLVTAAVLAGGAAVTALFLTRFRPSLLLVSILLRPAITAAAILLAVFASGVVSLSLAPRLFASMTGTAVEAFSISATDALLVGYAVFGTLIALIAWIGVALDALVTSVTIMAAGTGAVLLWWRREMIRLPRALPPASIFLALPLLFAAIEAMTPVNSPDELVYKLAVPHAYQLYGRMLELPLNSNSYLVIAPQFTDLAALISSGGMAAKLARFVLFLASLAAVHRAARRVVSEEAALAITAMVAYTPALMLIAGWCWNEWCVLGLLLGSYDHYQNWIDRRTAHHGAIAFALLGAAVASKYTALPWLLAFGLIVLARQRRERRIFGAAAVLVLLFGAFFYLRNAIWTGSPLAPLLLPNAPGVSNFRGSSGWADLARGADIFDPELIDESLGIIVPVAFIAGLFALASRRRDLRDLALLGAIQMPLLLTFAPGSRNMLNGVVPLAIAGAALIAQAWTAEGMFRVVAGAMALIAGFAQTTLVLYAFDSHEVGEYLAGKESPAAYVVRIRSFARSYSWINATTPQRSRVLLLAENRPYYLNRQFIAGGNLDGPRIAAWLARFSTPEALHAELLRMDVTHVLLHKTWYRVASASARPLISIEREYVLEVTPEIDRVLTTMLKTRAILRYRDGDYLIFEVRR